MPLAQCWLLESLYLLKAVCARFGFKKVYMRAFIGLFYMLAIDESLLVYWNTNDLPYASRCFQRHFNADYDNAYQRVDKRRQAFGMSLWNMSLALGWPGACRVFD
ncbi:hypothetical protein JOC94_000505 [Bacillus thermophilus]|uniref:Uncharacterized protein n=1 Tax=Siminovitchia thermophila TaxID=1245522 RepID=A0ABS2R1M4_9BACI|nr:hypothetical protein [Siminovitchia thermophila]MBM7713537.1 hypothetical protein [Siminovitchia thermophila]